MLRTVWIVGVVSVLLVFGSSSAVSQVTNEIEKEMKSLESSDSGERATAVARLGTMGAAANPAIPRLVRLLDDDANVIGFAQGRTTVAKVALDSLRKLGEPAGTELLRVAALQPWSEQTSGPGTEVWTIIVKAIHALGELRETRAVPLLVSVLLQPEPEGASRPRTWDARPLYAASALAKIQGADAFDTLEKSFRLKRSAESYLLTDTLAERLAETGGTRAVTPLLEWLTQVAESHPELRDPDEVQTVIGVLGKLKDQRSSDGLCAVLERGRLTALKKGPNVYDMTNALLAAINNLTGQSFKDRSSALLWWKRK